MLTFEQAVSMIEELDDKRKMIIDSFCESWDELGEVLRKILIAKTSGRMHCNLDKEICPKLYAKELRNIGFDVKETDDGYIVFLDKE